MRADPGETWACARWILGLQGAWALGKARKVSLCSREQVPRAPRGKNLALSLSKSEF